jgi:hypothetical protein
MTRPKAPAKLGAGGRSLWSAVVGEYELRADELRLLEHAARTVDLIDDMAAELAKAALMVPGSMGQTRPHPLLTEIRGHRGLLATLLKQLDLPDTDAPGLNSSQKAGGAARTRWRTANGA